ncbi:transposase [Kribbella sp. NBC_00889]|uniref:transposase n=1 Tax=Kribbella sp. NBC_00889 TaxID=2975974 RepID=UPI003865B062|nr:transposase [Kribbella sp. NBC_00889]
MQLSHTPRAISAVFDDPNLVSAAGLVPIVAVAEQAGLRSLADEHLSVPTDKGANAGLKVASLVAGMVAGADSIDDLGLLRHGGMGKVFERAYAPSTLGSFLRAFTFGHVRQLDAVASRFLTGLADQTHRGHAIIEQVNADLKSSALAHLPSGTFWANAAWLVLAVIAFNLTRAAATLAGDTLSKATTPTIRRTLITVPARIASTARRLILHLPTTWPWDSAWTELFTRVCGPPRPTTT